MLGTVTSSLLVFGSACHFVRIRDGVQTAGALGVALKCFGLVDYLRSFLTTGSLVRMISVRTLVYHCVHIPQWLVLMVAATPQVIMADMVPFMLIMSFAMLGCAMFISIHLPSRPEAGSGSSRGLFIQLMTVYHMTLGIGQGIDTARESVMTVVVVTVFMSFVVVVLYALFCRLWQYHVSSFIHALLISTSLC